MVELLYNLTGVVFPPGVHVFASSSTYGCWEMSRWSVKVVFVLLSAFSYVDKRSDHVSDVSQTSVKVEQL